MGPGILPETTVGKHNPPCHLQMPTKSLLCKKEAICEHRVLWAKAHLKRTVSKWKSVLWSYESKFDIFIGNHGRRVLRTKEEGDLPASYQRSVQKPASLMVWGYMNAYMGSLHVLEGTMNTERYIKVLEQQIFPSRWRLFWGKPCVFQQDNAKPHTAAIRTAWLRSRRVRVLNWPACSPDTFTYREHLVHHKMEIRQRLPQTLQQLEKYQARMGPNSNTKAPETHNLDAQTSSNCFEKKRRCYTMANMPPSQLFWDM